MPPVEGGVSRGAGADAGAGSGVGVVVAIVGADSDVLTGAGARTTKKLLACTRPSAASIATRRWRPGASSWKVRRADPSRAMRPSSRYRNARRPVGFAPLRPTRTVGDWPVWEPRLGVRMSRRGATAALLVAVLAGAAVVFEGVVLDAPPPDEPPPHPTRVSPRANAAHAPPSLPLVVDVALIAGFAWGLAGLCLRRPPPPPRTPVATTPSRAGAPEGRIHGAGGPRPRQEVMPAMLTLLGRLPTTREEPQ